MSVFRSIGEVMKVEERVERVEREVLRNVGEVMCNDLSLKKAVLVNLASKYLQYTEECEVEETEEVDEEVDEEVVWKWRGMLKKISEDQLCSILSSYYTIIVNVCEEISEEMRMDLCKYMYRYCNVMDIDLSVCKYMINISDSIFVDDMNNLIGEVSGNESMIFYMKCLLDINIKQCYNVLCVYDTLKCGIFMKDSLSENFRNILKEKYVELCNDPIVLKSKYKEMFFDLSE